ncbi:hypothetical protein B566_EDAN002773 [Ephemera danica]|nr:hypothetical protein B566_EDAN002773 [Ephemera danica]
MQKSVYAMSVATTLLACALMVLAAEDITTTALPEPVEGRNVEKRPPTVMTPPAGNKRIAAAMQGKVANQGKPGTLGTATVSDAQLLSAIQDSRYMRNQIKCTLGEGPCDPVGRKLKALAPLVMKNICFQCTPTEKRQIQMVVSHIQRNFPREWSKIVRQFGST